MHSTRCPEVRAIYKIVSTAASLAKYEQYLSVSSTIDNSLCWLTRLVTTANKSKLSATLLRKTKPGETRDVDGTGRQGSAELEIKECLRSVQTLRVPCVAS